MTAEKQKFTGALSSVQGQMSGTNSASRISSNQHLHLYARQPIHAIVTGSARVPHSAHPPFDSRTGTSVNCNFCRDHTEIVCLYEYAVPIRDQF